MYVCLSAYVDEYNHVSEVYIFDSLFGFQVRAIKVHHKFITSPQLFIEETFNNSFMKGMIHVVNVDF